MSAGDVVRLRLHVTGVVQGVGFRPFVHRRATVGGLAGHVGNDRTGVVAEIEGPRAAVDAFVDALATEAPPLARIDGIASQRLRCTGERGFRIVDTTSAGAASTLVPPDVAVCDACLIDLFDPGDHRYRYPFLSCTDCGPRFTITTRLPYDRPNTTMAGFELCEVCAGQYADPADRRFHAQPLACAGCGPRLWLERGDARVTGTDPALAATQRLLADGAIVAIKGLGGYHLACDATSADAVARLRARKHRPDKPLAVMVRDANVASTFTEIDPDELALLTSPARPIVLLRRRGSDGSVAGGVAAGSVHQGVLLPYTPLHHLLFASVPGHPAPVPEVLVMTSGNLVDEPICHTDDEARERLATIADAFVVHDRPIQVPCDDSVVRVVGGRMSPLRRSRGYVPLPVDLPAAAPPLLAVGGDLKHVCAVASGRRAALGPHLGDLGAVESGIAAEAAAAHLAALFEVAPERVVADRHPGYHSTSWAERSGVPVVAVQHHHAHLAALMAEHGLPADARVVGVVFDGTGFGDDATVWGGEVLVGGYTSVERVAHLRPTLLPGGDSTARRPALAALAHLRAAEVDWSDDLPPVAATPAEQRHVLSRRLEREVNCVTTSSAGRLFDALAALVGLSPVTTFEAQAAIAFEALAERGAAEPRTYRLAGLDPRPLIRAVARDVQAGVEPAAIAAGAHAAIAEAIAETVTEVARVEGLATVGLTGGVFQNAVLALASTRRLEAAGLRVLRHEVVPPNDGGLALGQAAVAAVGHGREQVRPWGR